ncbi:MAG: site-specific DNA-methyltransferase [Synergistaceae bacterium]|nr:site-specific DNA-methyltransferase [Synergistaceae bacterium]
MCGDATKREDVDKLLDGRKVDLILTDPPYGMKAQNKDGSIGGKHRGGVFLCERHLTPDKVLRTKKYPMLLGDENQDTAQAYYEVTKDICKKQIIFGGQYFAHFLPVNGGWLFWDKLNGGGSFSDGELAWRSWGKKVYKYEHKWNGMIRAGSPKLNGKTRVHPTQKPVELFARILEDFSEQGDIILDCFGGAGTTLIACEVTGRKCLMMELSPDYCEIIVARYREIPGLFVEVKK